MVEFKGETLTMFDPDAPAAAASLIERSKAAEWTLLSSNSGNWPDWADFSVMKASSYDAKTEQFAVRRNVQGKDRILNKGTLRD